MQFIESAKSQFLQQDSVGIWNYCDKLACADGM